MKRFAPARLVARRAVLSLHLLAAFILVFAPAPARAAAQPAQSANPSYQFLIAKLLAAEGQVTEAIGAFEQAEKLEPDSPYVRLEHAQLLARLTQAARRPTEQRGFLRQAAELVEQARKLAPESLDVLRGAGGVYVTMAAREPTAMDAARAVYEQVLAHEPGDAQSAITLGRIYLEQRQPARAAQVFRDLIERAPQQRAAYALLIEALLQAQKNREAETALSEFLSLDPDALEARLTLAELQSQRDDHRAALATLSAAPEPGRSDQRLRRQLAWAYYLTGDVESALAAVGPLRQADPEDVQLTLLEGLVFSAEGRNGEAIERFTRARAKRPQDPALTLALARVLEREGRHDEAAAAIAELVATLAKSGKAEEEREARLELAQVYYGAKEWDKVETALAPLLQPGASTGADAGAAPSSPGAAGAGGAAADRGASLGPEATAPGANPSAASGSKPAAAAITTRTSALLLAAEVATEKKDFDKALALLGSGKPSPLLTAKRAEILLKAGRDAEARRDLDELAASGEPRALLAAAQSYQRLERYTESIPLLERLVARQRDSVAAGFLLAAAYERTGKRQESVAEFRRILALDPNFHAALNYLGYMFAERGENLEEARKLIERAVALEPDNGAYVDSLGWLYFHQGQYELARTTLERATHLETGDATVQEHLGDVYGALGQRERAGEAYRRALALGKDSSKAGELRRKLDNLGQAAQQR